MAIYFSISSEGFGHSSRALALATHLQAQCPHQPLLLGTYGIALARLQGLGLPCVEVPQEVRFVGREGGFDVAQTILQNQGVALGMAPLVQQEVEVMKQCGATLVVADGRMSPVLAAAQLDLPCLVLTNQSAFYPFFEQDSAMLKLLGLSFDWLMKLWLCSAEEILIPDFPPPYSVCLPNLTHNPKVKKRTRFVGPLVGFEADDVSPHPQLLADGRPVIAVSLGGHSYRRPLFDAVLHTAQLHPQFRFDVLTPFEAETPPDNVYLHRNVSDCAPYFMAAKVVITQAGHSTAMELLTLGKPCIVVPDAKQIEQENNALRLEELGVAVRVDYGELPHGRLTTALEELLHAYERFEAMAMAFRARAKALQGAASTAQLLAHYAQRLTVY